MMEYSNPCGSSQPPFFNDNMSHSQFFHQDELLEVNPSWIESLDPALRNQSQPIQQSWQSQQQPLQRFMGEPERAYFTAPYIGHPSRILARGMAGPSIPISTLPQAPRARLVSPAPSQDLRSTCSSERSPGAGECDSYPDISYYSPQQQDASFSLTNVTVGSSHGFSDSWTGQQAFPPLFNHNCVNMSQVHLNPDPQVLNYEADEGYIDVDLKSDYHLEVDTQNQKSGGGQESYQYPSDEGIGASVTDGGSPDDSTSIRVDTGSVYDEDADGDAEDIVVAEHASDTEYSPRSTRTRKRRASKPASPSIPKRTRIVKHISKSKGKLHCTICNHTPFKEMTALQRHVAGAHTRPFICVFDFAGCNSTFASKNEWKRHVSSQHLNLHSWICALGACAKIHPRTTNGRNGEPTIKGSEFNRKDLFTQHLRRMHTPANLVRMTKESPEWEDTLKELQSSCLRLKRQPPTRLACPLDVCDGVFEGGMCWDERMEHVGKHLEKAGTTDGKENLMIRQVDDELLVSWALREGIVERRVGGGFRLCGERGSERGNDEDAEGEEE